MMMTTGSVVVENKSNTVFGKIAQRDKGEKVIEGVSLLRKFLNST